MSVADRLMERGMNAAPPGQSFGSRTSGWNTGNGLTLSVDFTQALAHLEKIRAIVKLGAAKVCELIAVETAGALATATRISAKVRPIVTTNPDGEKRGKRRVVEARTFFAKGVTNGKPYYKRIYADSAAEARQHPLAKIKRSGLARSAWFWIKRDLGGGMSTSPMGARVIPSAYGIYRQDGENIRMTNRLRYAESAFFSKGRATVDNVAERTLGRIKKRAHYLMGLQDASGA